MRITFKRIELSNFMSFEDEVFDFSRQDGMTLVQGINNDFPGQKNGSGKTNAFLSIYYALFGEMPVPGKMKNENIINRQATSRDLRVVLQLEVDGTRYKIARTIAKKASSLEVKKLVGEDAEEDLTKSSIAETQEMVESEILKCDSSIFLRTILLTADQNYNFYLLKKADKKEFVEKLFDISVFEDMWKLLHRDILDLGKDILAKQSYLLGLSRNVDDYETRAREHQDQHEAKLKMLSESAETASEALEKQRRVEIKSNASMTSKLESALEKLDERISSSRRSELELGQKISKCDLGIHKLESSKSSNQRTIAKHSEVLDKLCDDCKVVFKSYYSLDACLEEISAADAKIAKLTSAKAKLEAEKSSFSSERLDDEQKVQKVKAKLRELNAEANEARAALAKLESRVESLRDDLARARDEKNPWLEMLEKSKTDTKERTAELERLGSKHKKLELAESIVSQDTLRKFIIKDLVVLLNNKIKTYLTKLGASFYVVFDENMDYEFVTTSGGCEWGNFSAGERMKIMVATSFAFRDFMSARNGLNANLLVLDEYFDSAIDDLTVESVLSLLREMSSELGQSIYVITHRREVAPDMFDHLMVVEKTDGTSHIKLQ